MLLKDLKQKIIGYSGQLMEEILENNVAKTRAI